MAVNRELWKAEFSENTVPAWLCPICRIGTLELIKDSLRQEEPNSSKRLHQDDNWDPEWIVLLFSAQFQCSNRKCGEIFACCGSGRFEHYQGWDDEHGEYEIDQQYFRPQYFHPPMEIWPIPDQCPRHVRFALRESFSLFFASRGACANHLRIAVEEVLTDRHIRRYEIGHSKRRLLSLHERLKLFKAKDSSAAQKLTAIKWIGNAGSHPGELSVDDVLDAYEIFEDVVSELYVAHHKGIAKVTKRINKSKGPTKRRPAF